MSQEKIQQLQAIEQSLQTLISQKQSFQSQSLEMDSAIAELGKTDSAYKIIGNIMVKSSKIELKKDLEKKKELAELRIKTLEKQEAHIREKAEKIQSEVLKSMDKK